MKAALFGGSFDPPHIGHVKIVKEALKKLNIDKLFIVPTYLNPFKKEFFADGEKRFKWLKKIFEDFKNVEILKYEIEQKRSVATIETIRYLYKKFDIEKLYLIIGEDNLKDLKKWKDYEILKNLVTFVVATRGKKEIPKELIILDICVNISSTELRANPKKSFLPPAVSEEIIKFYKEKNAKQNR